MTVKKRLFWPVLVSIHCMICKTSYSADRTSSVPSLQQTSSIPALNAVSAPSPKDSPEALLISMQSCVSALAADPADRTAQKALFDSAKRLSKAEALPSNIQEERAKAVESAKTYTAAEENKIQRLKEQVGVLLRASANIQDPMVILEASRQTESLSPLVEDPHLEAYVNTIYERLGSALKEGRFTDNKLVYEARGYLYFHQKDWDKAGREWERALQSDKNNSMLKNLVEKAKKNAAREKASMRAMTLLSKGKAYFASGQFEKSTEALKALVAEQPDNEEAQRLLAESRARFAEQERSRQISENLAYGLALKKERKYLDASEYFLKVIQIDPQNEEAQDNLKDMMHLLEAVRPPRPAAAQLSVKKTDEAASLESSEQADAYYQEGLLLYIQGKKKEAKERWKQAVQAYPMHDKARAALERITAEENFSGTP